MFDEDKMDIEFQSTLPVRGATLRSGAPSGDGAISIHAPLAESDAQPGNAGYG